MGVSDVSDCYSPLEHVASIIAPAWMDSGEVLFAMLTVAFDCGGDEHTHCLTVAGFVSSAKDWIEFSKKWKSRLDDEGLQYFRAVEAAHFRKQFQVWHDLPNRDLLRKKLSADLMDILKSHVYRKFGCTIINKLFPTLSRENREHYKMRAYSHAARTCIKHVRDWVLDERMTNAPIEFVFEDGDPGATELKIRLIADLGKVPLFRPKKDTVEKDGSMEYGFIPLQAADWLAYELSNAHEKFDAGTLTSWRWPFEQFNKIPGEPTTYTEENLQEQDKLLDLNRQIDQWARKLGKG
jgi:hypothetical protein